MPSTPSGGEAAWRRDEGVRAATCGHPTAGWRWWSALGEGKLGAGGRIGPHSEGGDVQPQGRLAGRNKEQEISSNRWEEVDVGGYDEAGDGI